MYRPIIGIGQLLWPQPIFFWGGERVWPPWPPLQRPHLVTRKELVYVLLWFECFNETRHNSRQQANLARDPSLINVNYVKRSIAKVYVRNKNRIRVDTQMTYMKHFRLKIAQLSGNVGVRNLTSDKLDSSRWIC